MSEDREKRRKRMKNKRSHYAQSLEHPIHRHRIRDSKLEDDAERRYRRFHDMKEIGLEE